MKLVCLKDNLKEAVGVAERMIGKNITLPVLSYFFLTTEKESLRLTATDLEIGIEVWMSCKTEKEGLALAPARIFSGLINNLTDQKLHLETKEHSLVVKTESNQTTIAGADPKDFPIIPKIDGAPSIQLEAQPLREGLAQVVTAAALTNSRPELNSVFWKKTKNALRLAATDIFRLAQKTVFLSQETAKSNDFSFVLPLRTSLELVRILEGKGKLKIQTDKNQAVFETEGCRLYSRLLEGTFPDYEQVIPQNFETEVVVDKQKLAGALRLSGLFAGKDGRVNIQATKKGLVLEAGSANAGQTSANVEAKIQGKDLKTGFNYHYLLDGLSNLFGNNILFRLNSAAAAMLKSSEKDDLFYLVMPMRSV